MEHCNLLSLSMYFFVAGLFASSAEEPSRFHHMTVSDTMQREMPAYEDHQKGIPLAYPEAVMLTNPANPVHKGKVDDKYMYSIENKDTGVHGWISANPRVGFWIITAVSSLLVALTNRTSPPMQVL